VAYHIYTSKALVLSARPRREADRVYSLLTRDLGLIQASAGGVRKEASKLRGSLEPMSFSSVSLVKGKEYWRITSANIDFNLSEKISDKFSLQTFAKVFSLLEQLLAKEVAQPEIYDSLERNSRFVIDREMTQERVEKVEIFTLLNILHQLGYVSTEGVETVLGNISEDKLEIIEKDKPGFIGLINKGLKASHLIS